MWAQCPFAHVSCSMCFGKLPYLAPSSLRLSRSLHINDHQEDAISASLFSSLFLSSVISFSKGNAFLLASLFLSLTSFVWQSTSNPYESLPHSRIIFPQRIRSTQKQQKGEVHVRAWSKHTPPQTMFVLYSGERRWCPSGGYAISWSQ